MADEMKPLNRSVTDTRTFPTDDTTLAILEAACTLGPGEDRTHLQDFLNFGTVEIGSQPLDDEGDIVENIYVPGYEPWSEHDVIRDLIAEIRRLRDA